MTEALEHLLETTPLRLAQISSAEAVAKGDGGWSKKQILGHLIDSAANNHQRLVRGQLTKHLDFPSYEQDAWVAAQAYATEAWPDLVNLWLLLNRHLVHVVRNIPKDRLSHTWSTAGKEPVTLGAMFEDYVQHLEHHLSQIFS